ncbi:hypothetical protein WJX73_000824 [Symbiochloris irregularis]|uniref:sulfite oxidase n=1 Tax=Symbiochloris irregularis TaxID=706552 RepID=A0AAW1NSX1_9CHLO
MSFAGRAGSLAPRCLHHLLQTSVLPAKASPSALISANSARLLSSNQHSLQEATQTAADDKAGTSWKLLASAGLVGALLCGQQWVQAIQESHCEQAQASAGSVKDKQPGRPTYTAEEVAKHTNREDRVWVTHKQGVYDVTDWLDAHPGGPNRLMLAAGGSVDPFWAMYQQHMSPEVQKIMEGYRIGDLEGGAPDNVAVQDPYANEPKRHRSLVVRTDKPFNAEPPLELLAATPLTANDFFYIRNHLPVPHVNATTYKLRVEGEGMRAVELTLKDLQTKFKKHTVAATLQCSGNRRAELNSVKAIKGLTWDTGAIGTAEFAGVRLRDVLQYAGLDAESDQAVQHIQFEGLDSDVSGDCYGASIPIEKAVSPFGDVLLAYEMNGRALPLDHGFPLRVVAPGITGARSVKWLSRIIASKEESKSHWQQKDYKSFSPMVDWDNVDWSSAPAIQETNVTSAIVSPSPNDSIEGPTDVVSVKGWAFSGGGQAVIRVDVSADGGATWTSAELNPVSGKTLRRAWAWTLWEAEVE